MRRCGTALTLLLAALMGSSSAAAQSQPDRFYRPNPDDPSLGILREIFGNLVDFVAGNGTAASLADNDTVIAAGFSVFCTGVLTLGLLFVAYTTIMGVVNTAHDGEFLGKKMSSVWIPMRTAVGSALLLPLAGGFCAIQIIVMWLAVQGVGLSNSAWTAMLSQVEQTGMVGHPNISSARPLVANILRSEVCMAAMNKSYAEAERPDRVGLVKIPKSIQMLVPTDDVGSLGGAAGLFGVGYKPATVQTITYSWQTGSGYTRNDICGKLEWEESSASQAGNARYINLASVYQAHGALVDEIILQMRPVAQAIVAGEKPNSIPISEAAYRYENRLRDLARAAVRDVDQQPRDGFVQYADRGGFLTAGTYFNHIISIQDAVQLAVNSFPTSQSIDIDDKETESALYGYRDAMAVTDEYLLRRAESATQAYEAERESTSCFSPVPKTWEAVRKCMSEPALWAIAKITENLAGANTSHVAQVKAIGNIIINSAYAIVGANFAANFATGTAEGATLGLSGGFSRALESVGFLLSFMAITLLAAGAMMAFYIPMIPFISWVTGLIKWISSIVEAMIAAPIWGAAHIHPDGDDAVGRAGPGYFIALAMFMRPTLMIFGLFCAIAVANPVAHYVNGGFMMAVSGAMHDSANGLGALVAYSVIYVIIMTTVLHAVFALINWVPDTVMRWMGSAVGMHGVADREDHESQVVFAGAANRSAGVMSNRSGGAKKPPPSGGGERDGGGGGGQTPKPSTAQKDHQQREF